MICGGAVYAGHKCRCLKFKLLLRTGMYIIIMVEQLVVLVLLTDQGAYLCLDVDRCYDCWNPNQIQNL